MNKTDLNAQEPGNFSIILLMFSCYYIRILWIVMTTNLNGLFRVWCTQQGSQPLDKMVVIIQFETSKNRFQKWRLEYFPFGFLKGSKFHGGSWIAFLFTII